MTHNDLSTLIDRHLPEDLLRRALRAVFQARKVAFDKCAADFLSPEDADNVRPFYARGKVQEYLREIANQVPGCEAKTVPSKGSFWNHTEVYNGPLVLTAHSVQEPCGLVDGTDYQLSLARAEESLFGDEVPNDAARLYALLLHSPFRGRDDAERREFAYLPGSVYVAFPAPGIKYYMHQINLFDQFPDVVDRMLPNQWDEQARVHYKWFASQRAIA